MIRYTVAYYYFFYSICMQREKIVSHTLLIKVAHYDLIHIPFNQNGVLRGYHEDLQNLKFIVSDHKSAFVLT